MADIEQQATSPPCSGGPIWNAFSLAALGGTVMRAHPIQCCAPSRVYRIDLAQMEIAP